MARAWIVDLWVKDATVTLPDGTQTKLSPSAAQLKSVRSLPEHFRTSRFGKGLRWRVAWYEADGTQTKQRTKHFAAKRDAEAYAAELEDDIRMGRYVDPAKRERPYAEAAEAWLKSKGKIKESTWRRYRRELDSYVLPKWRTTQIGAIEREAIDDWVQELLAGTAPHEFKTIGKRKRKRRVQGPLSPAYVQHIVGSTFGAVLRFAVESGWIGRNPAAKIELPRTEESEDDLPELTYEQIEELAAEAGRKPRRKNARADAAEEEASNDDRLLFYLLVYSGPRIGEATALKVKRLDLDRRRARVARTWTTDKQGKRKLGPPKTGGKRWLPIPEFLVDELREHVKGKRPDDYVFTTARGEAIDGGNWYNRVWTRMRSNTGIALGYSVHDLRHVAATLAIAAGADVKLVQQMLGHADARETLNTYAHLWPERTGEVLDLVAARRERALEEAEARAAAEEDGAESEAA